ncbi:MAG: hypothetical protein ACK5HT_20960 [Draconibacterium sp.]
MLQIIWGIDLNAKQIERICHYHGQQNNLKRMQYKTFNEQGLLIGSGAIESAQRDILQQRLKLSGQRWTMKGLQQVANLV